MVQIGKKNMAARGGGHIPYIYIVKKVCEHSRSHIFCLIILKFCLNIDFIDISDEFENGHDRWKNMTARGRGSFLYMYIVKTCEQSRRHIVCPIFMKFGQEICFLDTMVEFENGSDP